MPIRYVVKRCLRGKSNNDGSMDYYETPNPDYLLYRTPREGQYSFMARGPLKRLADVLEDDDRPPDSSVAIIYNGLGDGTVMLCNFFMNEVTKPL